ncbi:hypothetical protein COOONC_02705 [Cooperia oncophora]
MLTPNETIYENVDDIPNFFMDSAMSWAIALILLEYLMTDKKNYALNGYKSPRFGKHYVAAA